MIVEHRLRWKERGEWTTYIYVTEEKLVEIIGELLERDEDKPSCIEWQLRQTTAWVTQREYTQNTNDLLGKSATEGTESCTQQDGAGR